MNISAFLEVRSMKPVRNNINITTTLKYLAPLRSLFFFTYGSIVHLVAEEFIRCRGERSINEIWVDVRNGTIELEPGVIAPPLPTEYAKRLPTHLSSILKLSNKIGFKGLLEHPFYYDLDPPNGIYAKGFIDRLIIDQDKAFIIDYKTTKKGKWRVNKHTVKNDLQLRTYARVVQKEFNIDPKNINCALYYLEDSEIIAARYSEDSLISAQQELLQRFKEIEAADPEHVYGKIGPHCDRCAYVSLCPFAANRRPTPTWDHTSSFSFG